MFATGKHLGFRPPHGSGDYRTLFDINARESSGNNWLNYRMNGIGMMNYFDLTADQIKEVFPNGYEILLPTGWRNAMQWVGFQGHFRTRDDIDKFLTALIKE